MDLSLLTTLKEKLLTAKRFNEVLDYFLTNFGEKPEFIALGERIRDPFLEQVIQQVAEQLFKKGAKIDGLLLTRLPEQQFVHGACFIENTMANVLYFQDACAGLLVVAVLGGQTQYCRFSGHPMRPPAQPSAN